MGIYSYDKVSGKPGVDQFATYLENYLPVSDYSTHELLRHQLTETREVIGGLDSDMSVSMLMATQRICGSLDIGYHQLGSKLSGIKIELNELNKSIRDLTVLLDWKSDLMIEQLRINNSYLKEIISLLKIPDSQKQRAYHNEEGSLYLKSAIKGGTDNSFWTDAFTEFNKSLLIENKDYFALQKTGFIYLFSKKYYNVSKAKDFFNASSRYSSVHGDRESTYESLLYSAKCAYILGNYKEAVDTLKIAATYDKENPEPYYLSAKSSIVQGNYEDTSMYIREVIKRNRYYLLKMLGDPDFNSNPEFSKIVTAINDDYIEDTHASIQQIESVISPESAVFTEFDNTRNKFNSSNKSLFDCLDAIDVLLHTRQGHMYAQYNMYEENPKTDKARFLRVIGKIPSAYAITKSEKFTNDTIYNIVQKENLALSELPDIKVEVEKLNSERDKKIRGYKVTLLISGILILFFIYLVAREWWK